MKLSLDTGSNFVWSMSKECASCHQPGRRLFDPSESRSFAYVNDTTYPLSFGPWGTMKARLGKDALALTGSASFPSPFYVSTSLDDQGGNFAELDWEGGLGLPSIPATADPNVPAVFPALMSAGLVDPGMPFMSFCTDYETKVGEVLLGGVDTSKFDPYSGLFLPFTPYPGLQGQVEYIWTTPLSRFTMGANVDIENGFFCLDTGSSCFKGDPAAMRQAYADGKPHGPPAVFQLQGWSIVVTPDIYRVTIEAGQHAGQTLPQFTEMDLPLGFVLAGSVLLDHLYTVYEYDVTAVALPGGGLEYLLYPLGMWVFNKTKGLPLVQGRRHRPKTFDRKKSLVIT
jgi:hypothetical protein